MRLMKSPLIDRTDEESLDRPNNTRGNTNDYIIKEEEIYGRVVHAHIS